MWGQEKGIPISQLLSPHPPIISNDIRPLSVLGDILDDRLENMLIKYVGDIAGAVSVLWKTGTEL